MDRSGDGQGQSKGMKGAGQHQMCLFIFYALSARLRSRLFHLLFRQRDALGKRICFVYFKYSTSIHFVAKMDEKS